MPLMLGKYNHLSNFAFLMKLPPINIHDYTYNLPEDRIASYPLIKRDESKLLVYNKGQISHTTFSQLPDLLPDNTVLFFNNTKVIPARFFFEKDTGAKIEVFLLQPVFPSTIISVILSTTNTVTWKCAVGNLKKWNDGIVLKKEIGSIVVEVRLADRENGIVEFTWKPPTLTFAEIIHAAGAIPLPPYIKRSADESDTERYQTVYSQMEGAVAAPTAGLHFTDNVLEELRTKGIETNFLTLHVSAGTFMPVKVENAVEHSMHTEQIIIPIENIKKLLIPGKKIIAVGTTALRTLESLYWYGTKLLTNPGAPFIIEKLDPYIINESSPSAEVALNAVLDHMDKYGVSEIMGQTSIYIFPGYEMRICQGLITNFHQPGSTLLLLIAALTGADWKKIYDVALINNYRFLSYGDSSLLLP